MPFVCFYLGGLCEEHYDEEYYQPKDYRRTKGKLRCLAEGSPENSSEKRRKQRLQRQRREAGTGTREYRSGPLEKTGIKGILKENYQQTWTKTKCLSRRL